MAVVTSFSHQTYQVLLCVIEAGIEIVGVLSEQAGHSLDDSRVQYGVVFIHRFDDADHSQNVVNRLLEQIGFALQPVLIAILDAILGRKMTIPIG